MYVSPDHVLIMCKVILWNRTPGDLPINFYTIENVKKGDRLSKKAKSCKRIFFLLFRPWIWKVPWLVCSQRCTSHNTTIQTKKQCSYVSDWYLADTLDSKGPDPHRAIQRPNEKVQDSQWAYSSFKILHSWGDCVCLCFFGKLFTSSCSLRWSSHSWDGAQPHRKVLKTDQWWSLNVFQKTLRKLMTSILDWCYFLKRNYEMQSFLDKSTSAKVQ